MKKVVVFFVFVMVMAISCANNERRIVGIWTDIEGRTWVFSNDGKLSYNNNPGDVREYSYSVTGSKLAITLYDDLQI
jgi:hypothetical protein